LLINNAGVFFHPPKETVDKFDVTFQTNYLGRFDAMYVGELNYLLIIVIFLQGIFF
jgi:NAD(P)-dependent dehydrogenase (short-subunit alcohol dehydrogenase family)